MKSPDMHPLHPDHKNTCPFTDWVTCRSLPWQVCGSRWQHWTGCGHTAASAVVPHESNRPDTLQRTGTVLIQPWWCVHVMTAERSTNSWKTTIISAKPVLLWACILLTLTALCRVNPIVTVYEISLHNSHKGKILCVARKEPLLSLCHKGGFFWQGETFDIWTY